MGFKVARTSKQESDAKVCVGLKLPYRRKCLLLRSLFPLCLFYWQALQIKGNMSEPQKRWKRIGLIVQGLVRWKWWIPWWQQERKFIMKQSFSWNVEFGALKAPTSCFCALFLPSLASSSSLSEERTGLPTQNFNLPFFGPVIADLIVFCLFWVEPVHREVQVQELVPNRPWRKTMENMGGGRGRHLSLAAGRCAMAFPCLVALHRNAISFNCSGTN